MKSTGNSVISCLLSATTACSLLLFVMNSCTTYSPEYRVQDRNNTEQWIDINKDSTESIAVMISMLNDIPSARMIMYSEGRSLPSVQNIDVLINEGISDSLEVSWEVRNQQKQYLVGRNFNELFSLILRDQNIKDTSQVYLGFSRRYLFDELPEKLTLKFLFKTSDTTLTGQVLFKKTMVERQSVMRWH